MSGLAILNFSPPVISSVEKHIKETMPNDVDCSCVVCPRQHGASYKLIKKNESCYGFRFKFRNNEQGTHVYDKSTMLRTAEPRDTLDICEISMRAAIVEVLQGLIYLELGLGPSGGIDKLTTTHITTPTQFDKLDANDDDVVTIDEFLQNTHHDDADKYSKVFDSLDTNYDGVLTIDEMPEEAEEEEEEEEGGGREEEEEEEPAADTTGCSALYNADQVGQDWAWASGAYNNDPLKPGPISWKIWNKGTPAAPAPFDLGPAFNNRWNGAVSGEEMVGYMNGGRLVADGTHCGAGSGFVSNICVGIGELEYSARYDKKISTIGFCYPKTPPPPPPPPDTTGCSALYSVKAEQDWEAESPSYNPDHPLNPGSISWKIWTRGKAFDLGTAFNNRWNNIAAGEDVVGYVNGNGLMGGSHLVADGDHCGDGAALGTAICVGIGRLEGVNKNENHSTVGFCYPKTPPPNNCSDLDAVVDDLLFVETADGSTIVQGSLIWLEWKVGEGFPTDVDFSAAGGGGMARCGSVPGDRRAHRHRLLRRERRAAAGQF